MFLSVVIHFGRLLRRSQRCTVFLSFFLITSLPFLCSLIVEHSNDARLLRFYRRMRYFFDVQTTEFLTTYKCKKKKVSGEQVASYRQK